MITAQTMPGGGPLISVIVPVYNVMPFLDICVESIVTQTYRNTEIMLIDDGSTGGSGGRCECWRSRDSRVRLIRQENRGLSGSKNTGLDNAAGEYISFVDADNCIHPEMLERMLNAILPGGCDLAVCDYLTLSK